MIESGDYVDIRFSTVPRYNKPVGVYWLQTASTLLFGHPPYNRIWTYRIPSLIGAILTVLLAYWLVRSFAPPAAMISAALLGLTLLLAAEARIAKTDALLLAAVTAAQWLFLRAYLFGSGQAAECPPRWLVLVGWAAVGIGILLKGPLILFVLAITAIAISLWDGHWKWLRAIRPGWGILVAAALVLPWALAIAFASHGAFYQKSLGHDFAAKVLGGQESHGAPPGYYLALAGLTLWPVTLFALPAIGWAILRRSEPAVRYLIAWLIPNWLLFELVPTKLPHYILPVYPAIAVLAGLWITRQADNRGPASQLVLRILAVVQFVIGTFVLAAAAVALPNRFGHSGAGWLAAGAGVVLLLGFTAAIMLFMRKASLAVVCASIGAVILYPLLAAGVAPALQQIWLSPHLAERVVIDRNRRDPPVVLAGYVEPSLVFLLGSDTHIESGANAAGTAALQGGLALVEDHERDKFLNELRNLGARAAAVDQVSGFNYSRGRHEHITFYRVTPIPRVIAPPPD
ncbi:MAG TPA: glycosyltransferase family 39 protein [Rhizomicrobium sp.]|nr:glycosyltransferase family 39 protein [Rhizomicrobium sp.]